MFKQIAFALALSGLAGAANACSQPSFSASENAQINPASISQATFSSAVTKATNYFRCKAGKKKGLSDDPKLVALSADVATRMAAKGALSHDSSAKRKRLYRQNGIRTKIRAENIAVDSRLAHGGRVFITRNAATCDYDAKGGGKIPAHSYASLAMTVVGNWMNSPGHKANIMHRRVRSVGTAAAWTSNSNQPCGAFFMAQNFAD